MTADGNWNIKVDTPLGERLATLSVKADGSELKGNQAADGNSTEIFDGTVNGDDVSWKVSISDPMPMTLEFTGKISGYQITGSVQLGAFGPAPFSGSRS